MAQTTKKAILCITLAFFLMSCAGAFGLGPPATPTPSAAPSATPQPPPTFTPYVLPTIILSMVTPTFDLTAPEALECRVKSQSMSNGAKVDPKERFSVAWQVKNIGQADWEPERIRFAYYSGSRLQISDENRVREIVPQGATTSLIVDMVAPRSTGGYTTSWALWADDNAFCRMTLFIRVR